MTRVLCVNHERGVTLRYVKHLICSPCNRLKNEQDSCSDTLTKDGSDKLFMYKIEKYLG